MASNNKQTKPKSNNNKFENPWNKWPFGLIDGPYRLLKWILSLSKMSSYRPNLETDLPIMNPYFIKDKGDQDISNKIRATWLGHASVLVEIDGFRVLCDPVFGDRCPPIFGPRRFRAPPCQVKDLPLLDAVVISHNHYDHMDYGTIRGLSELQPNIRWLIPKNDTKNLTGMLAQSSANITEMTWWDKVELNRSNHGQQDHKLAIYFTPTQHWSNRGALDAFKSLWGSWTFVGPKHRFWFGGDTGYCDGFKEIGDNFGPFDGAAIPIGAYEPRELTQFQHVDPKEALQIHKDIKSKVSFGIHWGTFQLTSEPYMEPKEKLEELVKAEKNVNFFTMNHGETLEIFRDKHSVLPSEKKIFVDVAKTSLFSVGLSFLSWLFKIPKRLFCSKNKCTGSSSRLLLDSEKDDKEN